MLIGPQISPADAALAARLAALRAAIASAAARADRTEESVTLIAVSKGHDAEHVRQACSLGIRDVGESYLQEALAKRAALLDLPLVWHFIGRLQANKTRPIAEQFDWVHGVDRLHIAERLSAQRPATLPSLNICVQVSVAGEVGKGGVAPAALAPLAAAIERLPHLRLRGLMCILPAHLPPGANRPLFATLRDCLLRLNGSASEPPTTRHLDTLSMGMSEDFASAIAEGATCIRIGTALFGPRQRPASPSTAGLR
ncbi:MAG TPA: YggS family pyridoxal phosphate-dependent enzyme [Steroidobacteraceae bacterium]|nr:YggS family pyridoxal phosphate-dependent enzyme [Steroidobacteraceae bacterium]